MYAYPTNEIEPAYWFDLSSRKISLIPNVGPQSGWQNIYLLGLHGLIENF